MFHYSAYLRAHVFCSYIVVSDLQPNGFNIEISNSNPRVVMVGVRIQIGCQSVEKAPSFVEIFGRVIQLVITRNRWVDLAFTREESLSADKKFSLFSMCLHLFIPSVKNVPFIGFQSEIVPGQ